MPPEPDASLPDWFPYASGTPPPHDAPSQPPFGLLPAELLPLEPDDSPDEPEVWPLVPLELEPDDPLLDWSPDEPEVSIPPLDVDPLVPLLDSPDEPEVWPLVPDEPMLLVPLELEPDDPLLD